MFPGTDKTKRCGSGLFIKHSIMLGIIVLIRQSIAELYLGKTAAFIA